MRGIFATFLFCGLFLACYGKKSSTRVTVASLVEPIENIQKQIEELTQVVKQLVENQQQMQQLIQQQPNHGIQQNQQQMPHSIPYKPNHNVVHQNQQHKVPHKPNHNMQHNQQHQVPQKPNHNMQQNQQYVTPQQPNHNMQQNQQYVTPQQPNHNMQQSDFIGQQLGQSCNMGAVSSSNSFNGESVSSQVNSYQQGNIMYLNERVSATKGQKYVCKEYVYTCDLNIPDSRYTLVNSRTC